MGPVSRPAVGLAVFEGSGPALFAPFSVETAGAIGASTGTCGLPDDFAIPRRKILPDSVILHLVRIRYGIKHSGKIVRRGRTTATVDVLRARHASHVASGCSRRAKILLRDQSSRFLPGPWRQGTGGFHYAVLDEPLVNGLVDCYHFLVRVAMGIHPFFKRPFTAFDAPERIFDFRDRQTSGIWGTSGGDDAISGQREQF